MARLVGGLTAAMGHAACGRDCLLLGGVRRRRRFVTKALRHKGDGTARRSEFRGVFASVEKLVAVARKVPRSTDAARKR